MIGSVDGNIAEIVLTVCCPLCSLRHRRPGTVSLSLATCDDDPVFKQRNSYHPTEFQITTGDLPGSACTYAS